MSERDDEGNGAIPTVAATAAVEAAAAPRGRTRRIARHCGVAAAWTIGIAIVVVLGLVATAAVLLSRGPLRLESAARAAEQAFVGIAGPGSKAHIGAARLDWSLAGGIAVDLADISVTRGDGLSLGLPHVMVRLRMLPLFVGRLEPRELEFDEPRLVLDTADLRSRSTPEGGDVAAPASTPGAVDAATIGAPTGPATTPPAAPPSTATPAAPPSSPAPGSTPAPASTTPAASVPASSGAVVSAGPAVPPSTRIAEAADVAVERGLAMAREAGIETVVLRGGAAEITHRGDDGVSRRFAFADIDADGVVDGPGGEFDAGISARGEVGRWSMRLTRTVREDGGRRLAFAAADVTVHDLIGPPGPAFRVGMPIYPRLVLGFGPKGAFDGADLDLRLGAGILRFGPMPEDEVLLDEAQMRAAWRPRERVFDIEHLSLALGESRANLHGRITPPPIEGGVWGIALSVDDGQLKPRDVPGGAVPIRTGSLAGTWTPAAASFDCDGATISFGDATLKAGLHLDFSGPEPRFRGDLQFTPMSVSEVAHAWPTWVAPDARTWFAHQVGGGRISDLHIRLDMPRLDKPETWPPSAMQLAARFDGLRFEPLGNLPQVVGGEGRITIVDRKLEAVFDRARAATKSARAPTADGLRFTIADIFAKPPHGTLKFQVAGDTAALAKIADAAPLSILQQAGIQSGGVSGTGSISAQIDITFDPVIDDKSIDYRVDAQLDGFASPNPIQGRKFQDGKFKIAADVRGVDVSGRATVDGVPADIHIYDAHGAKNADRRDFKMMVDDAARQRMGLDLGGMVEGAMGLSVSQPDPNQTRSRVEADLGPARLLMPQLGWTKGAGVPAKATFDLWDDDKGLHVDNLSLDSEGLSIKGSVLLDRVDRSIVSADFPRFALRKTDNAKLKVTRAADHTLTVAFDATTFDVRGLIQANRKTAPASNATPGPDLVLKLKAGTLFGFNDTTLNGVGVDARLHGGSFTTLEAQGRTGARQPLTVSIRPEGDHRRLTIASENAGAVLSFLDLFDRIQGGTLALSARLGDPGTSEGTARLLAFHLLEEPKAGRVAAREGPDGVRQVPIRRAEIDRSTDFDRASLRFAMHDGMISVGDVMAKGASVGATASGQIDLENQRMSLSGTYIPAYGLNNLASRIPIFGTIAGAGSNEGLVGVTFRVVGAVDDPILQINPLSAVAPGIFRRIFEFQNEDLPSGGGDPNAPTRILPDNAPTRITP